MSSLTGHMVITRLAVRRLARTWTSNPIAGGLSQANLPDAAIKRDIFDALNQGHWADFGQKHHFMRQFDAQSPYQAYESAVKWINTNALKAAKILAERIKQFFPEGVSNSAKNQVRGQMVFYGVTWQPLGNAVHALEDSFAAGHATRGPAIDDLHPGDITNVLRYEGDKETHEREDDAWDTAGYWFLQMAGITDAQLTLSGRLAVHAVMALLRMVITTAMAGEGPKSLKGWQQFRDQWLKASPELSRDRDRVFQLIDKYYTGARRGAWNIKTLNMDEEGLAKALLNESPNTVLQVFVRLDDQYNSDADDVAEIYVKQVQARGSAAVSGLQSNKELVKRLIKVMDEGWTSSGEAECIKFLKKLT